MPRIALAIVVIFVALAFAAPRPSEGWGQWKGQIIDAETKEPIEGVVVFAYWLRSQASVGGWAASKVTDVEETVTGPDGRFTLPLHTTYTIPAVIKVDGPETIIFKPGYGPSTIRQQSSGGETLIQLPRLADRAARRAHYETIGWAPGIAPEKMRKLREALDSERTYLGLSNEICRGC